MTAGTTGSQGTRADNLALIYQEVFTGIVRLRANRHELTDAESFRTYMREEIKAAIQEARTRGGYSGDDIKMATQAVVGFLDESVLRTQNPIFVNWPRKPLQEEMFGTHMMGEIFFQNLQQLMGRPDSADLADILEVHYLCMLLGFGGKYAIGGRSELQAIITATGDRIRRIRGASSDPFLEIVTEEEIEKTVEDPWLKKLLYAAIACFVLLLLLFVTFKVTLGSNASSVRAAAAAAKS